MYLLQVTLDGSNQAWRAVDELAGMRSAYTVSLPVHCSYSALYKTKASIVWLYFFYCRLTKVG